MRATYKGWKIDIRTFRDRPPRVRLISPDGTEWAQPWLPGKDEQEMRDYIKWRIDNMLANERSPVK